MSDSRSKQYKADLKYWKPSNSWVCDTCGEKYSGGFSVSVAFGEGNLFDMCTTCLQLGDNDRLIAAAVDRLNVEANMLQARAAAMQELIGALDAPTFAHYARAHNLLKAISALGSLKPAAALALPEDHRAALLATGETIWRNRQLLRAQEPDTDCPF